MTCLVRSGGGHVTVAWLRPVGPWAEGGGWAPSQGRAIVVSVYEPTCQTQPHTSGGGELPAYSGACVWTCMYMHMLVCVCVSHV